MNPFENKKPTYVFFGSAEMSVHVLDEMEKTGFLPVLIVTTPDKPKGRTLALTPTPVKIWGQAHHIPVLDPAKLDQNTVEALQTATTASNVDLFVVAAYGKIIPQAVLDIPPHQTLNIHPSLLPLYRGAAPLQSAILDDMKNTGITVMRIDAQMDHGPVVAQKKITVSEWPPYEVFEETMAREGARLLTSIMQDWVTSKIKEREQDHALATFTRKFTKEDGLVDIETALDTTSQHAHDSASVATRYALFRKIQAFHHWPTAYFFIEKKSAGSKSSDNITQKIRVKITDAAWEDGQLVIKKVIPEGKPETDFQLFMRSVRG